MKRIIIILLLICCCGTGLAQHYRIGDVYTAPDGSKGIVYYLHPNGGGWVVALTDASSGCAWGNSSNVPELNNQSESGQQILSDTAGYTNTQKLRAFQNNNTEYAAGVVDFANGWVLPSPAQLSMLYGQLPFISSAIIAAGGTDLIRENYWCSAECDQSYAWYVSFQTGFVSTYRKTSLNPVRAVRSFSCELQYDWSNGSSADSIMVSPEQTTSYNVTIVNQNGCTETLEKTIVVNQPYFSTDYATICDNEVYVWRGHEHVNIGQFATGIYTVWDSLTTQEGCDSVYQLKLTVNPSYSYQVYDAICENEAYVWSGHEHVAIGQLTAGAYTFYDSLTTSNGCDSVVMLHLSVNPVYDIDTNINICQGLLPYTFADTVFYGSGRKDVLLHTQHGCDSIYHVNLTVTPFITSSRTVTICDNELPYNFEDSTFYQAGVYEVVVSYNDGCNEIITLTLNVNPTYDTTIHVTACNSYTLNRGTYQRVLTESGVYVDTLTSISGCDSIVRLDLSINPLKDTLLTAVICQGESYVENGFNFTPENAGIVYDTLHLQCVGTGCDSTVYLELTVNPSYEHTFTAVVCDSFVWNNQTYTESGIISHTYTLATGCDSVVTLELKINTMTDSVLYTYVMENNLPYILNGEQYDSSGTYYQTLQNVAGCDSLLTLHLTVLPVVLPDNVDSADCTVFSTGHDWGIVQDWASTEMVSPLVIPLVGDIDGDQVPEIICLAPNDNYNYYGATKVMVFNTLTHQLVHTINFPERISTNDAAPYGIIKLPNGHVILVVALVNNTMHAYDLTSMGTTPLWSANTSSYYGPNVSFADFNGDSYPEIVIGNQIYDAETGTLLISNPAVTNSASSFAHHNSTPAGHIPSSLSSPCVANVVGDYRPDLILGNEIYEVLITNRYGLEGNSITLSQSITPPAGVSVDGHPQVADFNLDGHLDVFVSNKSSQYASVGCYVWDVYNNTVSEPLIITTNESGKSIPLIADIDNDEALEIVIQCRATSGEKVKCHKYNAVTSSFSFMWDIYVNEDSYSNSMSVFDFNNDGQNDLLISDQTTVRIVNGSGHSHLTGNDTIPVYVLTSLSFGECTVMQYPVVADVDADGSAELVVLGRFGSGHTYKAYLNIFRSASIPWAPARKVWNQYMYNVTNVNEDLTIPQYLFNNATAFTDPEGVVRRPFNNFLQQGTTIDQFGRPFYAVPDVAVNQTASLQTNGDSLLISISYCNLGDNTLNAPYPVTVFANTYGGDTICTFTIGESLPLDSCTRLDIYLPITSLCALPNLDSFVILVNCASAGIAQNGNLQPECDTTNNMVTIAFSSHIDTTHVTETACDTFDWYEHVGVTQSGDYTHVFTNAIGCDSTVIMHLTVSQSTHNVLDNTVCESYTWTEGDGETYTTSGLYTYDYTNAEGCASTDTLHLTIIPMPELSHTPDTVILTGTSVTLWSTGADVLYWSDASGNILASSPTLTVSPVTSTRYYLVGQNQGDCSVTDTIHVVVTGYPDNVDSADCVFFPEGTEWGIGQPLISSAVAITVTTPMVGDIDDDGQQEIVIPAGNYTVTSTINIFNADVTLKSQIHTVNFYIWNSVGLAKVKWQENEYKNIIVVLGTDKRLHAYDAQGTQLWQSNATFGTLYNESTPLPSVSFADFNHDGWTEIYIGAEIYDAATGVLLSKISGNKGFSGRTWDTQNNVYHTIAADLCGDYNLELAAGNTIYSVDIQSRTDFNANQMTVVKEVPSTAMKMEDNSSIPFTDGNTYLADLNLDGRLDVLVMNVDQSNRVVYLYVWDVETQSIICSKKIGNARKFGTPQIGDINQDGYDEICFIVGTYSVHTTGNNDLIYALRYNPQNNNGELDVLWTTSHSDNSACTGLTLFDFNQDGIAELVYRDRFNLRIINGSLIHHQTGEALTQPYDMAVSPCGSATGIEYPLVVDVDLDGEAEIVVGGATYETDFGHLYIFNSSGEPWAPARKVWNQYMYNVTNVNEDLTIPQYLFNNATAFTDPEGVVRRPFNNFLQQGTTIDQYGRPLYAVPDVVVGPFASSQMIGDSLLLTFSYCNLGDNPLNAPYSITVFANAYGGDMVCTVTVNESLSVDSCMNGKIRVPVGALCAAQPFDTLVIAVNCAGAGIAQNDNLQPECDTTNNMVTIAFSLHTDTTHVTETACDTFDWYEYEGVTQSGDYTHVFTNATGCDSTVIMHLTVFQSTHNVLDTIVCETYTWTEGTGETYTVSDTYTHAYTNDNGCASTDTLHLIILHGTNHVLDTTVCESFTWTEGTGETYTVSDTYTHAYTNADRCASVDTLHLTILHGTHHVLDTTVCESFTWTEGTGETYTVSDTYTYAYINDDGCASTDTLHLTILHGTHHVLDTTVCESFTWTAGTGETYTVSDTYTHSYINDDGCASTDTLHLMILHGTHHVLDTTVCESFTWTEGTGEIYTVSDTYTHAYINVDGCASTDTLHLTILHGTHHVLDTTVCESFTWIAGTGETYTVSDTYTHAYTNDNGCASTDTLYLIILHGTHHVLDTTVCESFTWTEGTGETYTVSDTYTYAYTNDDGCASVDTLYLTILHGTHHVLDTTVCERFTWTEGTGETYTVSDTYTHSYTNDDGCASVDTLYLTILHGTHHVLDTTVCESFTWTEGTGETYTVSDTYTHSYTNDDGCASTDTLHLTVRPLPVAIINGPSHLCEDSSIVLSSNSAASYQWNTGETTQSIVVHEEGTYTLVVTDEFGCSGDTSLRVSASYNPILNVNIPDMCAGGSYTISVGYQNENNVQLGHGSTTLSMVDTVFLPDGVPCEPHGCSYRSPLTFSAYGRNEVVESVEDIYYVRLNMEHSWAGDIYINITCPNGQKADIMKYGGSGISTCNSSIVPASRGWQSGSNADVGSYFGQAYDMENGSDICNPDAVGNEQGVGWNYCWSNNNTQGYVYAPGDGGLVYRSENEHYGILDSSNVVAGTHFYHPDQSFSSLIGCPLNGSWYIEVIDGWDVDNGYIFGWELALRNEVLSAEEAVFTGATSDGPWMTSLNDSLFRLDPPADLTQDTVISYTFHIFDDFGCQYDTTVEVLFFVPRHTIIDTVSCDAVVWNGVQYAVSGSYSDTLTSLHGCDSIVTLNLTINQCYIEENVDTMVCVSAMPYTWHGHLFAQAGEWIDTVDRNDGFFLVTTYQLSVSNPAVTEMGTSQITCFGGSDGQVQVLVSGGVQPYSYHWENAAGTTVATTAQLSNRPAGTYTLYVSDAIGCTTTQTVNLTHLSDSMMAGTIPQTRLVCMGNTLPLVTGTAASGGASSAYQWQFSTNGVNWNAAPTPNNSQNYNYPNAVTSSFFLRRAWVSQACGTVYSNVMSVTVSPLYADTLHDMVCQGYSYQNYGFNISETETAESTFIARTRQLQSSQGCDSSVTLLLTVIAPQHTTIADGTCQHSSYQANGFDIASEQLATAGEYTFEQQYVVNNCDSVVTLHLTVYPEYEVNLQAVVCEGDGYHQHGFNIPAVQTIGIDEVEVSQNLQSQHNCDSVVNLHLTVVDTSIAIVSLTEDFCEEYSADLSVETNATNYVWSTGETTPVITVNQPGLYTVTATQDNCIISAQYQIQKCEFNVYLPNAITPGLGDGINDYFCIHDHYKAMIEDFEIRIYSRWGELVYYSDDKDFKWNGEIKGRIIRQVIYTYLINFTDKRGIPHQLTGNITVL